MYPTLISLGPVIISSYGVMLVLAFLAGVFVVWKKGREEHFEEEDLFDVALVTTFWGLIGARLAYVGFHLVEFKFDLVKILALSRFPGLEFLGGLVAGIISLLVLAKRKKWHFFDIADVLVLGLVLAQVGGNLGAFLNGSGYGTRTAIPWAVRFPGVEGARHPTQVYGAIGFLLLTIILLKVFGEYRTYEWYKGKAAEVRSGLVFFGYLLGLGLIGVVLSWLKPTAGYWGGLAVEGWWSLGLGWVGVIGGYLRSGRRLGEDVRVVAGVLSGAMKGLSFDAKILAKPAKKRHRQKRRREITAGMDVK